MIKRLFPYICLLVLLVGCSPKPVVSPGVGVETNPQPVTVLSERSIRAQGTVVLSRQIDLSFPLTGYVSEVLPQEGDAVKMGEVVARLDPTELQAALKGAEADLAVEQAKLEQTLSLPRKADLEAAKAQVISSGSVRIFSDFEATAVAANVAAAQARLDNLMAQPYPEDVRLAQAEVDRARVDVDRAKEHLEQAQLVSPINGSVIKVNMFPGENVYSGQSVITVAETQNVHVEARVTDREVTDLHIGQGVEVVFSSLSGAAAKGTIFNIVPEENTDRIGQFLVYVKLAELPAGVRWGMPVDVVIDTGR